MDDKIRVVPDPSLDGMAAVAQVGLYVSEAAHLMKMEQAGFQFGPSLAGWVQAMKELAWDMAKGGVHGGCTVAAGMSYAALINRLQEENGK